MWPEHVSRFRRKVWNIWHMSVIQREWEMMFPQLFYQQICSIFIIYTAHQIKQTQREGKRTQTLFRGAFKAIQMKSMMYELYSVECVSCLYWLNALPYLPNLIFNHFMTKCKGNVNDEMSFRTKGAVVCG